MRGHHIGVAFHNDDASTPGDFTLGQVKAVENLRLVVDRCFRSIQILRRIRVRIVQVPRTEPDGRTRNVADRPHQAPSETIVNAAVSLTGQAGGQNLRIRESTRAQQTRERIPRLWRIPDPELRTVGLRKTAVGQESAAWLCLVRHELFAVEILCHVVGIQEALTLPRFFLAYPPAAFFIVQRDRVTLGEHLDGFNEAHMVDLLDEADNVSTLTTSEAVPQADYGAHVKRRGLLIVERAQALQCAYTRTLQGDVFAYHLFDPAGFTHRRYVFSTDHASHGFSVLFRALTSTGSIAVRTGGRATVRLKYPSMSPPDR